MSAIKLNDAELEALAGLPSLALRIYVLGIRPHMDYSTGLVGQKRRVSWQSLREAGYVEPHQGLTGTGTPSKMQVRRAVEWLIRTGLLVERTQGKRLVFYCPLAHADSSTQEKPDTNPTQTRHSQPDTHPDTPETPSHGTSAGQLGTDPDTNPAYPEKAKPDIPPVSGIRDEEALTHHGHSPAGDVRTRDAGAGVSVLPPEGLDSEASFPSSTNSDRFVFERFWTAYPRQVKKKEAFQIFRSQGLGRCIETILSDIERRQQTDRRWLAGYIPNPGNYLRERRWQEPIEGGQQGTKGTIRRQGFDETDYRAEEQKLAAMGFETDPEW